MIRYAEKKDLPAILDIYNEAIQYTTAVYHYKTHTLDQQKQWFEQKQEAGLPILVFEGEEDGLVYGFATYGPFRPHAAYQYTVEHSVYVHSQFRKKGLGTKLLKQLISEAEQQEFKTIIAGIDAVNTNSIAVHERLGFFHSGTITNAGYKFGTWLDLAFYQLDLTGPKEPTEN